MVLTGAPLLNSLKWEEEELSAILQPPFLENHPHENQSLSSTEDITPYWRSLPFKQGYLPTGLTQANRHGGSTKFEDDAGNNGSFLSTNDLSFVSAISKANISPGSSKFEANEEENLSLYYEHSFALHEELPSSQIVSLGSFTEDESFATEPEEFSTMLTIDSELEAERQSALSKFMSGHVSDLKDMPNTAYLYSITPQTMTVDLVVGIISIAGPRSINTRRGGREVELVELLVGDDTRTGFGINVWLTPCQDSNKPGSKDERLRNDTLRLRPRDIILATNVALCSFRGKVFGQSLRKGMTTLDLLFRNVVDKDDRTCAFRAEDLRQRNIIEPQMLKLIKVKQWVMQFVGYNTKIAALTGSSASQLEALPDDTQ